MPTIAQAIALDWESVSPSVTGTDGTKTLRGVESLIGRYLVRSVAPKPGLYGFTVLFNAKALDWETSPSLSGTDGTKTLRGVESLIGRYLYSTATIGIAARAWTILTAPVGMPPTFGRRPALRRPARP